MIQDLVGVAALKRLLLVSPQQAAAFLEDLPVADAAALLAGLSPKRGATCIEAMEPQAAARLMETLPRTRAAGVLERMEPQAATGVFRSMDRGSWDELVASLSEERRVALKDHLTYPEGSAGRLMTTDFVVFPEGMKVREVIQRLRTKAQRNQATTYAYVVGVEGRLVGVLRMRDLLLAERDAPVSTAMTPGAVAVSAFADRSEIVDLARDKGYLAVPVVDGQGRLVGAVVTGSLLQSSQQVGAEDLQLVFGGSADERPFSPFWFKVTRRLPWLQVNLLTAFLAAAVVALFQDLIGRISVLAVFLPIIAGQGGNAGSQSLAVILRGMVMREILPSEARRAIGREGVVGLLNGIVTGLVTSIAAWIWTGNWVLGAVVGVAMVVNLVAAGAAGAAIPVMMKRAGFDPAQSSSIFLTTVTDMVGFFAFLALAGAVEPWLG